MKSKAMIFYSRNQYASILLLSIAIMYGTCLFVFIRVKKVQMSCFHERHLSTLNTANTKTNSLRLLRVKPHPVATKNHRSNTHTHTYTQKDVKCI